MKLVTIDSREVAGRPGVILDDEILDLVAAPSTLSQAQWIPQSVVSVLAAGEHGMEMLRALCEAALQQRAALRTAGGLLPLRSTALLAPIRRPGLILFCMPAAGAADDDGCAAIIKSPHTALGDRAEVAVPRGLEPGLRANLRLGAVLGKPLFACSVAEAEQAIAGYTLLMDLSAPRPPIESVAAWRAFIDSKQFPGACPMGPAILTPDEVGDGPSALLVTQIINGVPGKPVAIVESGVEAGATVAELSARYGFRPGDVVALPGTAHTELRDGDRLEADLHGLMRLGIGVRF